MFAKLVTTLVLITTLFGSSGLTAYAAQDSMPDEALYPVKLWTEDLRLELRSDASKQIELLTAFANRRVDEAVVLLDAGQPVPDQVIERLENELDMMLQLLQVMDDDELADSASYVRIHLHDRDQLMSMTGAPDNSNARLEQLRQMLQQQHMMAELGQDEPLTFRQMFRYDNEQDTPSEPPEPPPGNQFGPGDAEDPDYEPPADGEGYGPGPQAGESEPVGPAGPKHTPEPDDPILGPEFKNGQPGDEPQDPQLGPEFQNGQPTDEPGNPEPQGTQEPQGKQVEPGK